MLCRRKKSVTFSIHFSLSTNALCRNFTKENERCYWERVSQQSLFTMVSTLLLVHNNNNIVDLIFSIDLVHQQYLSWGSNSDQVHWFVHRLHQILIFQFLVRFITFLCQMTIKYYYFKFLRHCTSHSITSHIVYIQQTCTWWLMWLILNYMAYFTNIVSILRHSLL